MKTYSSYLAQTQAPVTPPTPLLEWGVLGAIVFFLVKEGVHFFKQKDQDEGRLTATLIDDIRTTNKELRDYLQQQSTQWDALRFELQGLEGRLARRQTELIIDNRERLAQLEKTLEALHSRLDKASIHRAGESKHDVYPS